MTRLPVWWGGRHCPRASAELREGWREGFEPTAFNVCAVARSALPFGAPASSKDG